MLLILPLSSLQNVTSSSFMLPWRLQLPLTLDADAATSAGATTAAALQAVRTAVLSRVALAVTTACSGGGAGSLGEGTGSCAPLTSLITVAEPARAFAYGGGGAGGVASASPAAGSSGDDAFVSSSSLTRTVGIVAGGALAAAAAVFGIALLAVRRRASLVTAPANKPSTAARGNRSASISDGSLGAAPALADRTRAAAASTTLAAVEEQPQTGSGESLLPMPTAVATGGLQGGVADVMAVTVLAVRDDHHDASGDGDPASPTGSFPSFNSLPTDALARGASGTHASLTPTPSRNDHGGASCPQLAAATVAAVAGKPVTHHDSHDGDRVGTSRLARLPSARVPPALRTGSRGHILPMPAGGKPEPALLSRSHDDGKLQAVVPVVPVGVGVPLPLPSPPSTARAPSSPRRELRLHLSAAAASSDTPRSTASRSTAASSAGAGSLSVSGSSFYGVALMPTGKGAAHHDTEISTGGFSSGRQVPVGHGVKSAIATGATSSGSRGRALLVKAASTGGLVPGAVVGTVTGTTSSTARGTTGATVTASALSSPALAGGAAARRTPPSQTRPGVVIFERSARSQSVRRLESSDRDDVSLPLPVAVTGPSRQRHGASAGGPGRPVALTMPKRARSEPPVMVARAVAAAVIGSPPACVGGSDAGSDSDADDDDDRSGDDVLGRTIRLAAREHRDALEASSGAPASDDGPKFGFGHRNRSRPVTAAAAASARAAEQRRGGVSGRSLPIAALQSALLAVKAQRPSTAAAAAAI